MKLINPQFSYNILELIQSFWWKQYEQLL